MVDFELMESGLRVGEGGSGGCDEVKTKIEGPVLAILPLTLTPQKRITSTPHQIGQGTSKERNFDSQADSKVWCSSSLSAFLTASDIFVVFWVVLKKEGERKRSKERDLMARNTKKRQGVPSEEINEVVVFRGSKGVVEYADTGC
jgi:hypothetical protein